jgi:chromosomal replication initiation ATPase DnaA
MAAPAVNRRHKYFDNPEYIIAATCHVLNVFKHTIKGPCRKRTVCDARTIAIKIIYYEQRKLGKTGVGKIFNRDHSTVIYNLEKFEDLMSTDASFRANYAAVCNYLKNNEMEGYDKD